MKPNRPVDRRPEARAEAYTERALSAGAGLSGRRCRPGPRWPVRCLAASYTSPLVGRTGSFIGSATA